MGTLWQRLLRRPVSEYGRLCHGDGGHEWGARCREGADVAYPLQLGQRIGPLPEGSAYLGFIFSRAATPAEAEASLRRAHAVLDFTIR